MQYSSLYIYVAICMTQEINNLTLYKVHASKQALVIRKANIIASGKIKCRNSVWKYKLAYSWSIYPILRTISQVL